MAVLIWILGAFVVLAIIFAVLGVIMFIFEWLFNLIIIGLKIALVIGGIFLIIYSLNWLVGYVW